MEEQKGVDTQQQATPETAPAKVRKNARNISGMTPEEVRTYNRDKTKKSREKKAIRNAKGDRLPSSPAEVSKKEAREILTERGIQNQHVAKVLFELAEVAAQHHKLPLNDHLLRWGLKETQAALTDKQYQPVEVEDGPVLGELITRRELHALWDLSIAWREEISFEEFLAVRNKCKKDCFELGLLLGKDFHECHRIWADFLPKFNPDLLRPDYSQEDMKAWLNAQSEKKNFLLLASRNSYKSSFAVVWALSLLLCLPDARLLWCSETSRLSKGFIKSFRSYWTVKDKRNPVRFAQFYPEYCISEGEGTAQTFESPMTHLDLIQSVESTSMDSTVAGNRADLIVFDDPISNLTVGNETQRQASVDKYDATAKLREVGGLILTVATPWHEEDLLATLIKRNEKNDDKPLAVRIDPAFVVKKEFQYKLKPALLSTLQESEIESFLFPSRLDWKFLKPDILSAPAFFMSQNLVIFPAEVDADIKVQFLEDELRVRTRPKAFFENPISHTCLSLDRAWSVSKYADFSCLVLGKIIQVNQKTACVIADVWLDRVRESELVLNIIRMIKEHHPRSFVMERDKGYEDLWLAVQKQANLQGIPLPHATFRPISTSPRAKAKRGKHLELPLADGRLWFVSAAWSETVWAQFVKFDGSPSNSHKKDDAVDAIGLLFETYGPRNPNVDPPLDAKEIELRKREAEEQTRAEVRQAQYNRYFGANWSPPPPTPTAEPPRPADPRLKIFGPGGPWRL